ncbi:hypothetical protein TI03_00990 [Achromatium sp. WMS1]|nr:hypothetical protein TI03_00990 [Achromatium sp. WMS1]
MQILLHNQELLLISISMGLVLSFIFSEFLGITAGGLIVPGYMALFVTNPLTIAVTLALSFITYFVVHSLSTFLIIYGRRRTILMILFGFIFGVAARLILQELTPGIDVVGFIIAGLIAIWIDRQGIVETYSSLITSSIIIRLLLIIFMEETLI